MAKRGSQNSLKYGIDMAQNTKSWIEVFSEDVLAQYINEYVEMLINLLNIQIFRHNKASSADIS